MKPSPVTKRSVVIDGHKTASLSELVGGIDHDRRCSNLSSAVRLFVLDHYHSKSPA